MLSINTSSIKEVVSLWPALCILMQVFHLVIPRGSGRGLQRKYSRLLTPPSLPSLLSLHHCCQFNFECTFANQFLWLSEETESQRRRQRCKTTHSSKRESEKNCRWGRNRKKLLNFLWSPSPATPSSLCPPAPFFLLCRCTGIWALKRFLSALNSGSF